MYKNIKSGCNAIYSGQIQQSLTNISTMPINVHILPSVAAMLSGYDILDVNGRFAVTVLLPLFLEFLYTFYHLSSSSVS